MPVMSTSSVAGAAAAAGVSASSASSAAWAWAGSTDVAAKPAARNSSARRLYDFPEFITLPVAQQGYDAKTSARNCGDGIHGFVIARSTGRANARPVTGSTPEQSSGAGGRIVLAPSKDANHANEVIRGR